MTAQAPAEHIRIVLNGLRGKTIAGVAYTAPMPAFGPQLTDKQIAAVVNHARTNWGHRVPVITWEAVAAQRR